MPIPKRKLKPKAKAQPRYRNAAPPASKPRATPSPASTNGSIPGQPESPGWHIAHTALGAAIASGVGIGAAKIGINTKIVTAVLSAVSGYAAYTRDTARSRSITTGAATISGAQFALEMLKPTIGGVSLAPTVIVASATPPPSKPAYKNSDISELPPGALDAAFERARSQLAVSGDMHSYGEHEHDHGIHHDHVIHHQTVPFIP